MWDGVNTSLRRSLHASLHSLAHNPSQSRVGLIWAALVPLLVSDAHGEAELAPLPTAVPRR